MTTQPKARSRRSLFSTSTALRVLASVVFIPCFIIITLRGGYHFLALIDIVIFVGLWEFYVMMAAKGLRPYRTIGIVSGLALSWYVYFHAGMYANLFLTVGLLAIMTLELTRRDGKNAIYHVATTLLGVLYVAYLASHLVMLRELPIVAGLDYAMGSSFVFLVFLVTWAGDTGAYIVGSAVGRRPLLPRVSARKTVEGAVGGLVFAVAGAVVASYTFARYLDLLQAVILGVAAGTIGQLGDLFESLIKRDANVKDTSGLIPGHGGVLDRFDGLLFTAPLLYYYLKFVIFQ
ncbi:MAG: phosphatidate cytidylyltransferase [Candidatus Latescibacterota bacterium]|jgi:phosphatidate cytidylyltransferase